LYLAPSPNLKAEKFFDLVTDPRETRNLLGAMDDRAKVAFQRLMEQAKQFPRRDNDPQYRHRDANEWDVPVTVKSQQWKLTGSQVSPE
jgi:hypothetical protein